MSDEVTISREVAETAAEFVWTALLPDRAERLTLAERSMGEWVLAQLRMKLGDFQ